MTTKPIAPNPLGGLRRFAVAITVLNLLGHFWLGFEQSYAQPLLALATAYSVQFLLESLEAWSYRRKPRYVGGPVKVMDFFLSAHISGLAVAMLLFAGDRLWVISFAAAAAIASKTMFQVQIGKARRHFFNPSNFGIVVILLLFPSVGIAPPYMFTENLVGAGDWILPCFIICTGSILNTYFTRRMPLIFAWLGCFALQAAVRSLVFQTPFVAGFIPMTGVAFIIFSFYMITDPATSPSRPLAQVVFGASVAIIYGTLVMMHIVFGLFFALTIVCAGRGLYLHMLAWQQLPKKGGDGFGTPIPSLAGEGVGEPFGLVRSDSSVARPTVGAGAEGS